jgi:hypothetical protein
LQHGLAVSDLNDAELGTAIEHLSRRILDGDVDACRLQQARLIAEAELHVLRVRTARIRMIEAAARGLD